MMPQPGMMQGMDAFFTGHESVRELVSQLMLPSGVFERQDRRHAMLDTVLHRYEDKEREVEALKKVRVALFIFYRVSTALRRLSDYPCVSVTCSV
jgi:hypothetical protein